MRKLKLGIPKGSLQKATIGLFEKSGWKINVNSRSYFPDINDDEIECSICRAQEMSRYVENGTIDAGLTGRDWIEENESDVVIVDDLVYSKVSQNPARWVLAVPADSEIMALQDLEGKKIAEQLNEIHSLLQEFFFKVLKITDEKLVENISCEIEHHITEEVKESFKGFLSKYLKQSK